LKPERKCPGCGVIFERGEGIENRYGVASPECWQAFNNLLAHERTQWNYPDVHRLIVDAYSVQHPQNFPLQKELGIAPRFIEASVQSVAIHLIALYFALGQKKELKEIAKLMGQVLSSGIELIPLIPPSSLGKLTIVDAPLTYSLEEYSAFAWKWAKDAYDSWSVHHPQIEAWVKKALS